MCRTARPRARATLARVSARGAPPLPLVHVTPPSRPPRVRQGIGKAIAQKLAGQGLSVVLVALQDGLLDATHSELVAAYPSVQFRKARAPGRCA